MIAEDALAEAWRLWLPELRAKREEEKPDFGTIWSEEIENVLLLLLFLPCMSPKTVFGTSVQKILQFHKVSTSIFLSINHYLIFIWNDLCFKGKYSARNRKN